MSRFLRLSYYVKQINRGGLTLLLVISSASAQSGADCTGLFDQLDRIEAQGGQFADEDKLANARSMYEHLGCSSIPTDPGCQDLSAQIRTMQSSGLGNTTLAREHQSIMAQLRRAGCMDGTVRQNWNRATEGAKNPNIFERLYREGGGGDQQIWKNSPGNDDGETIISEQNGGHFRTLCVRSCDGFYWPISFSTRPAGFARDEQICAASCPKQQVSLYVHHNPGQGSDDAKSLGGEPYAALANAFLYRKRFVKECACEPVGVEQQIVINPSTESRTPPLIKAAEETDEEKLKPHHPQKQKEEDMPRKTVPIIVGPAVNNQKKTLSPNGLRGVSSEPLQGQ
jgi:hypothetical protein